MKKYFDDLIDGIEQSFIERPESKSARKVYALNIARIGARLYTPGADVAWCGVLAPFDLLNALGVTNCFVEFVGAMLASTGASAMFIEAAENGGYSTDSCAYHRAVAGATMLNQMPQASFIIATNCPCSGGLAAIENLARIFNKDMFMLYTPSRIDEHSEKYLTEQIAAMVDFVSSQVGRKPDPARIRQAIEYTNEARELLVETYKLARSTPSPARIKDLENLGISLALMLGTPEGVEVARAYRDEFKQKVEAGIGGVKNEKHRILWIQNRIQFSNPIIRSIEQEFEASIVVDELNEVYWDPIDPDDPYPGIAKRIMTTPLLGPIDRRIEQLQGLARDYKIDGAINPCHWGCRQGTGARAMVEKGLKEVGVPVLNLDVDCVDSRNFAEGQLRTRLEAFFEMIN